MSNEESTTENVVKKLTTSRMSITASEEMSEVRVIENQLHHCLDLFFTPYNPYKHDSEKLSAVKRSLDLIEEMKHHLLIAETMYGLLIESNKRFQEEMEGMI